MFDDDDPVLARVRALAHAMPGAAEKVSHGRPAFFTKKIFAYYGGSVRRDDAWIQHPQSIMFLPDVGERDALLEQEQIYVPAYLGPSGWLGFDLVEDSDWNEVGELIDASYRLTAGRRLVAELDARS